MKKTNNLIDKSKEKAKIMQSEGVELFPNDFVVKHFISDIVFYTAKLVNSEQENTNSFTVAGRVISINRFGKSSFLKIRDMSGTFQVYVRKDKVGDEKYELFRHLNIGDFIGFDGTVFQTKTGEWTLLAEFLKLLCKSTRPLPEKFHGLKDPEKRYRRRYVDLIINSRVRDIFLKRSKIIQVLRSFFLKRNYIEAETPMMHPIPGGAEAKPFKTYHNTLGMELFLRIAPELYLKRLVIGGFERVFEINRNFRNEGVSSQHNPEFTMIEFYQAYATYKDLMDISEILFREISQSVIGTTVFEYQGNEISLNGTWNRISMFDALEKLGGVDRNILGDKKKLAEFAKKNGVNLTKTDRLGKIITKLFDSLVEPKLIQPTFITGYPVEVSPLSRRNNFNKNLTDRFELFIGGREIANGFSELNNPEEQKDRFLQQVEDKKTGNTEAHCMDLDYIEAMEYGMPPTAGQGIGVDRLVMLLTNSASIREVILFPHMKPNQMS